ncbi:MAG: glycosyltransferase family 2 protein [Candidatus Calescibacterium sp.]
MGPLVSCIIPTYNRAHIVGRAIRSVLNQTYKNIEVIVVDDGSQDNTQEVVLSIKDERIRYIRLHRNFGAAFARNIGIANARGEFVAFLDSDDYFLPEKIEKQVELMLKDESIGVCYTEVYYELDNGELVYKESPRARGKIYEVFIYIFILPVFAKIIALQTFLVRKQIFEKIVFDESMKVGSDAKFMIELSKIADFDFIPLPLCVIDRRKQEKSLWRGQVEVGILIRHKIELFEERKSDIFKLAGSLYVSRLYNRFAWTAYKYGNKNLAAKLLFKSSFETRSLKDFLKVFLYRSFGIIREIYDEKIRRKET